MGARRALSELGVSFATAEVLALCYHAVRSRARFEAQMTALRERGYAVLSMGRFLDWLRGGAEVPSPAILLTFDSVYGSQLANAVPVLEALRLPATFFAVSDGLALEGPGGRGDLLALAKAGHTIGCHSHTHPDLTALAPAALDTEVGSAKRRLEDALGERVTTYCYPYGARNAEVVAAVRSAGFQAAFAVDLGGIRRGDDPYQLRRVPVLGEPRVAEFAAYLAGTRGVAGTLLAAWKVRERWLEPAEADR